MYFPGDIERTMWRSGDTDLNRLLINSIRWITRGESPVSIEGKGAIEAFAWETNAGFAVHLLDYTNPAMHRGWIREFFPIQAQTVRVTLPQGRKVTRVELLRSGKSVPFSSKNCRIEVVPEVLDYGIAALYSA